MADETPPLDDARLAEIRERWHEAHVSLTNATFDKPRPDVAAMNRTVDYAAHVGDLLAEVDRLRAAHNEAWDHIDRLSEDLTNHDPVAHPWFIEEADAWRDRHPNTQQP